MPPLVVFDTSVLLSAIGWRGKPLQCLELARLHQIQAVTCREIMEELAAKLQEKLDFTPEATAETIADLLNTMTIVRISGLLRAVPADPKDDMIVECAAVSDADYIVSGERRHLLPLGTYGRTRIVSPDALLSEIG
jgi:putative PIN family toxin of toxin-antitoxin system